MAKNDTEKPKVKKNNEQQTENGGVATAETPSK